MIRSFCTFLLLLMTMGSYPLFADEDDTILLACENGIEMFEWDLQFLSLAEQSIEISGCYCGGAVLQKMLDVIEERLKVAPELQVHILTAKIVLEEEDQKRMQELKQGYPDRFHLQLTSNVMTFLRDWSYIENHTKCVIVDEYYFSTGGTNLFDDHVCDGKFPPPPNEKGGMVRQFIPAGVRDGDLVGRGPIAREMRHTFFKIYALWEDYFDRNCVALVKDPEAFRDNNRYREVDTSRRPFLAAFETSERGVDVFDVRLVVSGPHQKQNAITEEYARLFARAEKEVVIGNFHFNPYGDILKEAMQATKRGVEFTLITNGIHDRSPQNNSAFVWASRIQYVPLFYGKEFSFWDFLGAAKAPLMKTHIYEYYVKDILYHKKTCVVDRRFTILGSYNLGLKSHISDYEWVLIIDSEEFAESVLQVLETDKSLSKEVTPKEAREWYFNPAIVYLAGTQRQFHGLM